MTVDINHEIFVFVLSFLSGVLCSAIFDFFRVSRKRYKQSPALIGLSDILFWIMSCIICYGCIFFSNNGELRFYEFAAVVIGGFIYFLTLNRLFNIIFVNFFKITEIILKIVLTPMHFLYKIIVYVTKFIKDKISRLRNLHGGKNELTQIDKKRKKFKSV